MSNQERVDRLKRIEAIYAWGGFVAANATIEICEHQNARTKKALAWVQRNRGFFSLFSRDKNDLYFSFGYVLAALECCESAYNFAKIYTRNMDPFFGELPTDENEKIFNDTFRTFLSVGLMSDKKISRSFSNSVLVTLAHFPSFAGEGSFVKLKAMDTIRKLTSAGKNENEDLVLLRLEEALLPLQIVASDLIGPQMVNPDLKQCLSIAKLQHSLP